MSNGSLLVEKNPAKVAAGQAGARARWGPPRVVRLDELTPDQARLILALLDATKKAPDSTKPDAQEVSRGSDRTAPQSS